MTFHANDIVYHPLIKTTKYLAIVYGHNYTENMNAFACNGIRKSIDEKPLPTTPDPSKKKKKMPQPNLVSITRFHSPQKKKTIIHNKNTQQSGQACIQT